MRVAAMLLACATVADAQHAKGDYYWSKTSFCPKGYGELETASVAECLAAGKLLKLAATRVYWTTSTAMPLGCTSYNSPSAGTKGTYIYFSPGGSKNFKGNPLYSVICKKKTAKSCQCPGGYPNFGSACPKNGATSCKSCHTQTMKFDSKKKVCNPLYVSKDKEKMYMISGSGVCPKGYSFIGSNDKECDSAIAKAGFKLRYKSTTISRGFPRGCSVYPRGAYSRRYWAGEGRKNYVFGLGYYKAVCKNDSAKAVKTCKCNHGAAPYGSACPKHGMKKCISCYLGHKLSKDKSNCDAFKSKEYVFSKTGTCPQGFEYIEGGKLECQLAAKALNLRDKTAYLTYSTYIPKGCSYYYGNSLYYAPIGITNYAYNYYHAICKDEKVKKCICKNGTPAHGSGCPKDKAMKCASCDFSFKFTNNKKEACVSMKGDYKIGVGGKCPKDHVNVVGSDAECKAASKALGGSTRMYYTSSTALPLGCSRYVGNYLYWAPKGTKAPGGVYAKIYQPICKHKTAKNCVCPNGSAAHGKACPKNKAQLCTACAQGFKMAKNKKTCDPPPTSTTKVYRWSSNGKCPKGFTNLATSGTECNKAASLLYMKDKSSRAYSHPYLPVGCFQYTSGNYADLRFNSRGSKTATSSYYRAVCKTTGGKTCKCANGTPSHGSACSGAGKPGCSKCSSGFELSKDKKSCGKIKSDYTVSSNGKCPKDFEFMPTSLLECKTAGQQLKLKAAARVYYTTSTYIPLGCSMYGTSYLYFAPKGSKSYRYAYYKAICKHVKAKDCVCANGAAAHGGKCPKDKAMLCTACNAGYKLASNKKTCQAVTSKLFEYSKDGKCFGQKHITTSAADCAKAAKALGMKSTQVRNTNCGGCPKGCFYYPRNGATGGDYLYFNKGGVTNYRFTTYKALCHHRSSKACKCTNGSPAMADACPKNGQAKCIGCNAWFKMNSAKTACVKPKSKDYVYSTKGTCPKDFAFIDSGLAECETAAAELGGPDVFAYATSSRGIPRGCSAYYTSGTLYWAPAGNTNYRFNYYKAICKHRSAKKCVCPHGTPAHGKDCPKNKAQKCESCNALYKMAYTGKTCVAVNSWKFGLSKNGKCPPNSKTKKYRHFVGGRAACSAAAVELNLGDKIAKTYSSSYQPLGCYQYKSGPYHDLRYNTKGRKTGTSTYYHAICENTIPAPKKKTECEKADLDGKGTVDVEDLLTLLGNYGKKKCSPKSCGGADIDVDGDVDVEDLLKILGSYGKSCKKAPPPPPGPISTSYIKITQDGPVGQNRNGNSWDLFEVECWDTGNKNKKITLTPVKASHDHYNGNYPLKNLVDGKKTTFWAGHPGECSFYEHGGCQYATLKFAKPVKTFKCSLTQAAKEKRWSVTKITLAQSSDGKKFTKPVKKTIKMLGTTPNIKGCTKCSYP